MVVVKSDLTPNFEQILQRYLQSIYSTHDAQAITSKFMNVSCSIRCQMLNFLATCKYTGLSEPWWYQPTGYFSHQALLIQANLQFYLAFHDLEANRIAVFWTLLGLVVNKRTYPHAPLRGRVISMADWCGKFRDSQ